MKALLYIAALSMLFIMVLSILPHNAERIQQEVEQRQGWHWIIPIQVLIQPIGIGGQGGPLYPPAYGTMYRVSRVWN